MATTYQHVQVGIVDNSGNVNVLYPLNTAKDVSVQSENVKIPSDVNNVQGLIDKIGDMAFRNSDGVVFIGSDDSGEEYDGRTYDSEIDDNQTSSSLTWSSKKINDTFDQLIERLKSAGVNIG